MLTDIKIIKRFNYDHKQLPYITIMSIIKTIINRNDSQSQVSHSHFKKVSAGLTRQTSSAEASSETVSKFTVTIMRRINI